VRAKTLQGAQKLKNPLRIQGEKLRRSSAFMHRAIAAKSQRPRNSLESLESQKLRRDNVFENAGETQGL
jgi:hypothetical protein